MATPKILLVDDVHLFLELEKSFLRRSPVRVLTARDGQAALQLVRSERPDLVFLDITMPVMDGLACCAAIKADPELCGTPVIMVTSAGKESDRELCLMAGCDDYLAKPVSRKIFLEKARRYIASIERRERRVACQVLVESRNGDRQFSGEMLDLSERGLYLKSDEQVVAESGVQLSFSLPELEDGAMRLKGRVAWINQGRQRVKPNLPPGFGVEFEGLSNETAARLRLFVESRAQE